MWPLTHTHLLAITTTSPHSKSSSSLGITADLRYTSCAGVWMFVCSCLLQDLDLRLNPVTKNEPDYRLFVVHLLVNLRKLGQYEYKYTYSSVLL